VGFSKRPSKLVAQRVAVAVEETTVLAEIGAFALKGLTKPVVAFNAGTWQWRYRPIEVSASAAFPLFATAPRPLAKHAQR
jgi:hypothetical protein